MHLKNKPNLGEQKGNGSVKSRERGRGMNTIQCYAERRRLNQSGGKKKKKNRHGREGGGAYGHSCIKRKKLVRREEAAGGGSGRLCTAFAIIFP